MNNPSWDHAHRARYTRRAFSMRHFFFTAALLVLPLLTFADVILAEEEHNENNVILENMIVTATRTKRKTEDIPAGVSVVSKEDIENSRLMGVKEALSGLSGVQSETRNGGYDARLIIRGAGRKARYGVREIMVLLDGIPITDPDGMTRLDFVDTQLIERVDVVKGPNSTLYGANASGGVVNVITKDPYQEIKSVKAGYGSDNMHLYNLIFGTRIGENYFTLTGSGKSTDGWREWNEFDTNQGGIRIGRLFEDDSSLELNFQYTEADVQLPGTLTENQFHHDITQQTDKPFRHSGRYSTIYSTSLRGEKQFGKINIKPVLYYQAWDHFHPVTGGINDAVADIYGVDIQSDLRHATFGIKGLMTAGVTAQIDVKNSKKYTYRDVRTNSTGRILYTLSESKGDLAEIDDNTITKWGFFFQESLRPTDKWIVDLGIRFDQIEFDVSTEMFQEFSWGTGGYIDNRKTIDVEKYYDYVSPRLGLVYKANSIYNLYANISTGFQTPQASELEENNSLDPARTINYETGVKGRFAGGHSIDLSLFYMDVSDEIVQTYLPDGQTSYSNAGETIKKGAELSTTIQPIKGLYIGGAYTYSDFKYKKFNEEISATEAYNRDDNQLPYVPRHQYSLRVYYRHKSGFKCQLDTHTWGKYYLDNANSEKYAGYDFLTNAFIGWEQKNWSIIFDVKNITDKHYAMEVTKDTKGVLAFYPGAPRTFFCKLSYKFN